MKKMFACTMVVLAAYNLTAQSHNTARAKELVGKMTPEEKANLVVGKGFNMPGASG